MSYLSILPVERGIEYSAAASFAPNPIYFDPENIIKLAIESGCNAIATTLDVLGMILITMELYLIRHGIAGDRDPVKYPNDDERPLTDKGRQKTKEVAQRLDNLGLRFDLMLTSPLVRAYQTAEILQKESLCERMEKFAALSPQGNIQDWVNWYLESQYNKSNSRLALVGHQPDLGNWAEKLVWGNSAEKLVVKKAGVIGLLLPDDQTPIGNSELFLLTSPKWLL